MAAPRAPPFYFPSFPRPRASVNDPVGMSLRRVVLRRRWPSWRRRSAVAWSSRRPSPRPSLPRRCPRPRSRWPLRRRSRRPKGLTCLLAALSCEELGGGLAAHRVGGARRATVRHARILRDAISLAVWSSLVWVNVCVSVVCARCAPGLYGRTRVVDSEHARGGPTRQWRCGVVPRSDDRLSRSD